MSKGSSQIFVVVGIVIILGLVGGYFLKSHKLLHNPLRSTPVNTPQSSSSSATFSDIYNWHIYNNFNLGFSVDYPQSWRLEEHSNLPGVLLEVTMTPDSVPSGPGGGGPETGMHIWVSDYKGNDNLTDYVNKNVVQANIQYVKGFNPPLANISIKTTPMTVSYQPAIRVDGLPGAGNPGPSIYVLYNRRLFVIFWEKTNLKDDEKFFNTILGSFRIAE